MNTAPPPALPASELPGRIGVTVRGVYDGVLVWIEPDGSLTNRFAGIPGLERRARAGQDWIDAQQAAAAAQTATSPTTET